MREAGHIINWHQRTTFFITGKWLRSGSWTSNHSLIQPLSPTRFKPLCYQGLFDIDARRVGVGWNNGDNKLKINKFGDLYSAYPALLGGSRRWEQSVTVLHSSRQATTIGPHIPLAVNSKSERKADLLPPLGLKPATFTTLAHLSAKFHPQYNTGSVARLLWTAHLHHYSRWENRLK
jgi:hypothetical protein